MSARIAGAFVVAFAVGMGGLYVYNLHSERAACAAENVELRAVIETQQESARASARAADARYESALQAARKAAPRARQRANDAREVLAYVPRSTESCAATADVLSRIRSRIAAGVRDDAAGAAPAGSHPVPDDSRRAAGAGDGG